MSSKTKQTKNLLLRPLQFLQRSRRLQVVRTIINYTKKKVGIEDYGYWVNPLELEEGINIASLVCPLRYDILIRREFFSFYEAHRDLYISDFDSFAHLVAQQTSYYTWVKESEMTRFSPELLDSNEIVWIEFVKRIRSSATLYESMMNHGFDQQFPVSLKTAEHLLPPIIDRWGSSTGKCVSAQYFVADGCHRLALLMHMGYRVLPTQYFQVKCFKKFSPFDSTHLLVQSLSINSSEYFSFLSSYYSSPLIFERGDDLIEYISLYKPEFLQEVLSVIRTDGFDAYISGECSCEYKEELCV